MAANKQYESFRPDFTFRCVYCLKRESWGQVTGEFELDHFEPQSIAPDRKFDYQNLVYACRRCNAAKLEQRIDDPWDLLFKGSVKVITCGEILGCTDNWSDFPQIYQTFPVYGRQKTTAPRVSNRVGLQKDTAVNCPPVISTGY